MERSYGRLVCGTPATSIFFLLLGWFHKRVRYAARIATDGPDGSDRSQSAGLVGKQSKEPYHITMTGSHHSRKGVRVTNIRGEKVRPHHAVFRDTPIQSSAGFKAVPRHHNINTNPTRLFGRTFDEDDDVQLAYDMLHGDDDVEDLDEYEPDEDAAAELDDDDANGEADDTFVNLHSLRDRVDDEISLQG